MSVELQVTNYEVKISFNWIMISCSYRKRRHKMKKAEVMSFGKPDEVRKFPKGHMELIKIGGATVGRAVFEPGWKWSDSIQPIAKTKRCEAPHFQYHIAGVLMVVLDTGRSLSAALAMFHYSPQAIMHGLWEMNPQLL